MTGRRRSSLRRLLLVSGPSDTGPRLNVQTRIIQHRPFQLFADWKALDFVGKPRLKGAVAGDKRWANDGWPEGAVAQAVSESVAITTSGCVFFEHAVLGIGGLRLGSEFGTLSFRRLGGGARLAASSEDRRGGDNHCDDEERG